VSQENPAWLHNFCNALIAKAPVGQLIPNCKKHVLEQRVRQKLERISGIVSLSTETKIKNTTNKASKLFILIKYLYFILLFLKINIYE